MRQVRVCLYFRFSGNPGYDDQVISGKKYRTRNNDKNKPQAEDQASQPLTEAESKPLFAEAGVAKCAPSPIKECPRIAGYSLLQKSIMAFVTPASLTLCAIWRGR